MFLKAGLGWLDGFPVGQQPECVEWQSRPRVTAHPIEAIQIDRERLRRAEFTLKKLVMQFPRAMPKVVGDVDAWHERVSELLTWIKSAIHDGQNILADATRPAESLPRTITVKIKTVTGCYPGLAPVLQAVVWGTFIRSEPRDDLVQWIAKHAELLERHMRIVGKSEGRTNVLMLADLARHDGAKSVNTLLELLCDQHCFEVAVTDFKSVAEDMATHIRRWKKSGTEPTLPSHPTPELGSRVVRFLRWLVYQPRRGRRSAEQLFTILMSDLPIRDWHTEWKKLDAVFQDQRRTLRKLDHDTSRKAFRETAVTAAFVIEGHLKKVELPAPIWPNELLTEVETACQQGSTAVLDSLNRVLLHIQGQRAFPARAAIFSEAATAISTSKSQLQKFLNQSNKYLDGLTENPQRVQFWNGAISSWRHNGLVGSWNSPLGELSEELPNSRHWGLFFEALALLSDTGRYRHDCAAELAWLVDCTRSAEQSAKCYGTLSRLGLIEAVSRDELEAILELTTDSVSFEELSPSICRDERLLDAMLQRLQMLHKTFQSQGWQDTIPLLLTSRGSGRFRMLVAVLDILDFQNVNLKPRPKPNCTVTPKWASDYPAEFHDLASLLESVTPDAYRVVSRILNRFFPTHAELDREIEALKLRLRSDPQNSNLSSRLKNLVERRETPVPVSKSRSERLRRKMLLALHDQVFSRFEDEVETRLHNVTRHIVPGRELPAEILSPANAELLSGLVRLKEPYRRLGLDVFRRSLGLLDWEPRDEHANVQFLSKLEASGIKTGPWLSMPPRKVQHPKTGRPIVLSFANNDRDVLLMGYHFGTCLSPREFNFFSAVVNAVDVNKSVLFAKDHRDRVVGRCLLAIGDTGSILSFHAYCHDHMFPFHEYVAVACTELAAEMGTVVSHRDRVSPLLTPDWYDDGAIDCGASITGEQSPLHEIVNTATEDTFVTRLHDALSPVKLDQRTLPFVLAVPGLLERPHLITPLLPLCENANELPEESLLRLAVVANKAGYKEVARRLVLVHAVPFLRRQQRSYGDHVIHWHATVVSALLEFGPSQLLRFLRQTRPRSVRSDEQEKAPHRRELLAAIHEQLGRPTLAEKLRRGNSDLL